LKNLKITKKALRDCPEKCRAFPGLKVPGIFQIPRGGAISRTKSRKSFRFLGAKTGSADLLPVEIIANKILLIRGQKVMISFHLAELYGVKTRALIQAVKRNIERFPDDFMFQLEVSEADILVSQNVIPHKKYLGGYMPYAFSEQGVAMLSSVLRSKRAVQINISIMRAFVKIREYLATHKDVLKKLEEHDKHFKTIFGVINKLLLPPPLKPKNKMGF